MQKNAPVGTSLAQALRSSDATSGPAPAPDVTTGPKSILMLIQIKTNSTAAAHSLCHCQRKQSEDCNDAGSNLGIFLGVAVLLRSMTPHHKFLPLVDCYTIQFRKKPISLAFDF